MKTKEMIYAMILILICFLVFSYKILNTQNEINKKQDEIISKIEFQNKTIITTINKSIDDKFENWFDCIFDN